MNRVLIVDDSTTIRKAITNFFKKAGFPSDGIFEAADGVLALEKLKENEFDLILTDINMPNMDGIEFINTVRKMGIKIPIISVSAEGDEEYLFSTLQVGASGCVRKAAFLHLMDQLSTFTSQHLSQPQ